MANKHQEMQRIIRMYRHETGETEVDMHAVAEFAVDRLGWRLPTPGPCTTNPDFRRLSVQDRFVHKNQARPLTRELPE